MYPVSDLWKTIIAEEEHHFLTKALVNGIEYDQSQIMEMSVQMRMFSGEQPGVGGCLSGELTVRLLAPAVAIPRMALVEPYVAVTDGTQTSEWIPQGKFYIDTRETTNNDDNLPILSLHCYDAILKAEEDYPSSDTEWPKPVDDVVAEIASAMGVGVDDRTAEILATQEYSIGLPAGYTMREVLSNIASMYAGNWVMNYDGELLLVAINGIPPETNYLIDNIGDAITFGVEPTEESASGSILSFDGDGTPFSAISIAINPVQSGTGAPAPDNIMPITGFDGANIHVSPTEDGGTVYTVDWSDDAGTVYGGTLDVTTGELTVNTRGFVFDGTESWSQQFTAGTTRCFRLTVASAKTSSSGAVRACSHYPNASVVSSTTGVGYYAYTSGSNTSCYIQIRPNLSDIPDLASWKAFLAAQYSAGTPVTCWFRVNSEYELTYNLDPVSVYTLVGPNNIWADTGDITASWTYGSGVTRILV